MYLVVMPIQTATQCISLIPREKVGSFISTLRIDIASMGIKSFPFLSKDYEMPNPVPQFSQHTSAYAPGIIPKRFVSRYHVEEDTNFEAGSVPGLE